MYTAISVFIGYILDIIFGDPYWMPHPIRIIGKLISILDNKFNKETNKPSTKVFLGGLMVCLVILFSVAVPAVILFVVYKIHFALGIVIESFMCYQILSTKCLKVESMKVYKALVKEDIEEARYAVSMIVGRDTDNLDEEGITKATVETIAENTSDGSIAPLIYMIIGGPILGFFYKAINTMDSMVGYKNDKYLYFGKIAAKLDDIVNYIPSRIAAIFMIFSVGLNRLDITNAFNIYVRDRYNHSSPNSAQTEAVCAGGLGIRLAGNASYFGKIVEKPYIGEELRKIEREDIILANRLLYTTATVVWLLGLAIRCLLIL